jgi:hypothetical protein
MELKCTYTLSFRAADCDNSHYLVVAKVRERLAMNKQSSHGVHVEGFSVKTLSKVESKGQYRIEVSDRFAALDDAVDINSASKTIRQNIEFSVDGSLDYYEFKKHEPWFEEG